MTNGQEGIMQNQAQPDPEMMAQEPQQPQPAQPAQQSEQPAAEAQAEIPVAEPKKKKEKKDKKEKGADISVDLAGVREALINYLIPLICLAASALLVLLVLMPAYKSMPELSAELEENSRLENTLREKLNNMNRLLEFKSVVEENSDLVNKVLVSEELVPGFLTQIDRITRESGMTVTSLNYGLGASRKGTGSEVEYNTVTVNLGAEGSFGQLKSFMENVERAARIVVVDNFRYTRSAKEDDVKLSVNFVLVSPYLFVQSDAVTDEPIDLDISDPDFQALINRIKSLKYYDPYDIDVSIPLVETPEEVIEGEEPATEEPAVEESVITEGTGETVLEEPSTEEVEESVFGN